MSGRRPVSRRSFHRRPPFNSLTRSADHNRGREFVVHGHEVRSGIRADCASESLDRLDRLGHNIRRASSEERGLSRRTRSPDRRVPDQTVRTEQTAKSRAVCGTRRHVVVLVNDESGEPARPPQQTREPLEHLLSSESSAAFLDDPPDGFEERRLDDGSKRGAGADPHVGRIRNALLLELEGDPVVDVVSNVLLVGQHLVDGAPRPGPPEIGQRAFIVEDGGDLALRSDLRRRTFGTCAERFRSRGPGLVPGRRGRSEGSSECHARARPSAAAVRR